MKEININMEGYNVNGICLSCLSHGRRMLCQGRLPEYYRALAHIEIPEGVTIQVCWECAAAVCAIERFQKRVQDSFEVLESYSQHYPFLNSPSDLTKYSTIRLKCSDINTLDLDCAPPKEISVADKITDTLDTVKEECQDDFKFEHIEVALEEKESVKIEIPAEFKEFFENDDCESAHYDDFTLPTETASDDEKLSLLSSKKERKKERKERKKKKHRKKPEKNVRSKDSKERRALQLKNYRKLNNLPEELVELIDVDDEQMFQMRKRDAANGDFAKLKYKCEDCISGFNTQKLMEDHRANKHQPKDSNAHQCDVCRVYLLTAENVAVHRRLHLVGYRCRVCQFDTGVKHLMMRHVKLQHRIKDSREQYLCTICSENFSTKSKLSYHRGVCHQERPQCDCCGKVFANKMTLKYHLKIPPYDKGENKPKEKLYLPCKGCSKVFYSRKSYRAHVVIHEGLEYPCPVCGKLFQWKRNLARHIRNHREKDVGTFYDCRACNKRFSSKDCYNNHMKFSKKHVSEDSYNHMCTHCGKKFPSKYCLVDHVDWDHFRKIKYECEHCGKAFKTSKIMAAHINNIHGSKKGREPDGEHLCDICGKSYKSVKRLKGHVWAMHTHRSTTKTYKCKLCPATFTWQTSIYKHMKMMHDNPKRKQALARATSQRRLRDERLIAIPLDGMQYFHAHNIAHGGHTIVPSAAV